MPWPSECVEKEARREQVVSWVETRAGKILHLCSAQLQSCPHASVFKSYSYAPNCLTSLSSDAVFVVQALLDCLTVHPSASIVLHCIKESTPFILGWLHNIEIAQVGNRRVLHHEICHQKMLFTTNFLAMRQTKTSTGRTFSSAHG